MHCDHLKEAQTTDGEDDCDEVHEVLADVLEHEHGGVAWGLAKGWGLGREWVQKISWAANCSESATSAE